MKITFGGISGVMLVQASKKRSEKSIVGCGILLSKIPNLFLLFVDSDFTLMLLSVKYIFL